MFCTSIENISLMILLKMSTFKKKYIHELGTWQKILHLTKGLLASQYLGGNLLAEELLLFACLNLKLKNKNML